MKKLCVLALILMTVFVWIGPVQAGEVLQGDKFSAKKYYNYNFLRKAKLAASYWVDPEVARNAIILGYVPLNSTEAIRMMYPVIKETGFVAYNMSGKSEYVVVGMRGVSAVKTLDAFVEHVKGLPEGSEIGAIFPLDRAVPQPLSKKGGAAKRIVSWGERASLPQAVSGTELNR